MHRQALCQSSFCTSLLRIRFRSDRQNPVRGLHQKSSEVCITFKPGFVHSQCQSIKDFCIQLATFLPLCLLVTECLLVTLHTCVLQPVGHPSAWTGFFHLLPCWSHLQAAFARVRLLLCQHSALPCLATKQICIFPVCHIHKPCPLPSCKATGCDHQLNHRLGFLMFLSGWSVLWVLTQRGVYDWCALSLGLAASVRPASDTLTCGRPPQVLCTLKNYILLLLTMFVSFAMYWGCLAWLTTRPWFSGGSGTSFEVRRRTRPVMQLHGTDLLHPVGCNSFLTLTGEHNMILSD